MKTKILFICLLLFFTTTALGEEYSMRRCMLLPITDTVSNAIGFKIYEKTEQYLKNSSWCEYVSSAEMLSVFSKYRTDLKVHLKDAKVINTVAKNLKVGTIIRIDLQNELDKLQVNLDIVGENGKDLFLSEKTLLNKPDLELTFTTIKNWLEIYEAAIPYDGKITGILGDQVTFSIRNRFNYSIGQKFIVKRLVKKKEHPLLQKIVAWETESLGEGKLYNLSSYQALGVIKRYYGKNKLQKGDWIKLEKAKIDEVVDDKKYPELKEYQFGKLGEFDLSMNISSSSIGTNISSGNIKMSGYAYGFSFSTEAWITRNYFIIGELSRKIGTMGKESGSPALDSITFNSGVYKIGFGYKYLPMGFFYGPQVNLYGGYVNYGYQFESSEDDGFGKNSLTGYFLGIKGSLPIDRGLRIFVNGEIIPFANFKDDDGIFAADKSNGSMLVKFGGLYQYNPKIKFIGSAQLINNSVKLNSEQISELTYKDTIFELGARLIF